MRYTAALLYSLLSLPAAAADLTVYTYDSFASEWGPGPKVEAAFEQQCGCDIELIGLDDGVTLLNRLKIEGTRSDADVVIGLDTNLTAEARATGLFAEHDLSPADLSLPVQWADAHFLPYDFGYFAFVYRPDILGEPPASLSELVENADGPDILIQDPRTSTPGLGLLLWMKQVFGAGAGDAWRKLAPRIVTVTKGWSESYGMFLKNEAPMVLSYTTSPAYHAIAEDDTGFAAAQFEEGHYLQIEVAGMLAGSDDPARAREFLKFMLGETVQQIIPTSNWMYPAALGRDRLPAGFESLIDPHPVLYLDDETVSANRREWIDEWLDALSR
ncbi:MAG: thiamine ABC transporter substrate binding subunit [Proteobacteria bacterium]|nr:MAG: thiamine ABC transporter substrate binding subunit [Pseudomonadota bacterium]